MDAFVEPRTLAALLAEAEAKITRFTPDEAHRKMESGAVLIDIRSEGDRSRDGIVPGSLHIPRTVLEWRTAPDSAFRNPHVGDLEQPVILICDHGCSTILAAAVLRDLGYSSAGDVIGGFADWRDAGLPVAPAPQRDSRRDEPAGMGLPDP